MARLTAGIGLLAVALAGSAAASSSPVIKEAGLLHGAVVAGLVGGPLVPVAQGAGWRDLPVISPDGTRIAFVQETDKKRALADIVVVTMDGREVSRTHVEPVMENLAYSGMQYVESLRWISPERLVAGGSINPSTSQYYMIDAAGGKVVQDFTDDASSPAFSPDGRHVVVLADSPHFGAAADAEPHLMLDDQPIWQPAQGTTLVAAPRFSADGSHLAWAGRAASGKVELDIWNGRTLHRVPLPAGADSDMHVFWSGDRAVATASPMGVPGKTLAWSADFGAAGVTAQLPGDPDASAMALRHTLVSQADAAGVKNADVWCASCSLSLLPRVSE